MSSLVSRTLGSVSTEPRTRNATQKPSAPIPHQQKKTKAENRERTQAEMDEIVSEWFTATDQKIDELAKQFNKKPRYFRDLFFNGGARMAHHHDKVNAHRAFLHLKSQELRDGMSLTSSSSMGSQHTFYC